MSKRSSQPSKNHSPAESSEPDRSSLPRPLYLPRDHAETQPTVARRRAKKPPIFPMDETLPDYEQLHPFADERKRRYAEEQQSPPTKPATLAATTDHISDDVPSQQPTRPRPRASRRDTHTSAPSPMPFVHPSWEHTPLIYPWHELPYRTKSLSPARALLIFAAGITCLIITFALWPWSVPPSLSRWVGPQSIFADMLRIRGPIPIPATTRMPGDYTLRGAQSLSADQVDAILAARGSPAQGTGHLWIQSGQNHNIDAAFAIAFFIHESSAGTNPNWAGQKGDGTTTHNVGNIICAGYPTCYGRFRDYPSWEAGIEDWFRLINYEYIQGRNTQTVAEIIPIYAPAFENDVQGYINHVQNLVDEWRSVNLRRGSVNTDHMQPWGNPLQSANTVMTQGYGVGTHAPATTWGAIDLAIDGTGNGIGDPHSSMGAPIYATHAGSVKVTPNSYPGGNHVWVENEHYRTGYAHLASFTVETGQWVERGDQIGTLGSTGMSSGPHLDYQVWQRQDGQWVNQNPLHFGVLD